MKELTELRLLVSQYRLKEVFNYLLSEESLPSSIRPDIILLKSQFHRHLNQKNLGLSNSLEEENRIIKALLSQLDEIESKLKEGFVKKKINTDRVEKKKNRLIEEIDELEELLTEWKKKQSIAQTPSELKQCELEIKRLEKLILAAENKLQTL
jgi:uncharacterized protein YdiU (UPF0061 family)